ncbi:hypothetical protein [Paenibacillus artemisiicola]|nr:hypothetical protein [Paenibacillus artemisiicola]
MHRSKILIDLAAGTTADLEPFFVKVPKTQAGIDAREAMGLEYN